MAYPSTAYHAAPKQGGGGWVVHCETWTIDRHGEKDWFCEAGTTVFASEAEAWAEADRLNLPREAA